MLILRNLNSIFSGNLQKIKKTETNLEEQNLIKSFQQRAYPKHALLNRCIFSFTNRLLVQFNQCRDLRSFVQTLVAHIYETPKSLIGLFFPRESFHSPRSLQVGVTAPCTAISFKLLRKHKLASIVWHLNEIINKFGSSARAMHFIL